MTNNILLIDSDYFEKHSSELLDCIMELKDGVYEESKIILDNMSKYLKNNTAFIFVSENRTKVNGFIWGYLIDNKTIHINYFVVLEKYRNQGIGNKLISNLLNNFKEYDFELLVNKNNLGAVKLYEKMGFVKKEYTQNKYKMIYRH